MNDIRKISKIAIILLGVLLIVYAIPGGIATLIMSFFSESGWQFNLSLLMFSGLSLLWILYIYFFMIRHANKWTDWIFRNKDFQEVETSEVSPISTSNQIFLAYRLICFIAGFLFIYKFSFSFIQQIFLFIQRKQYYSGSLHFTHFLRMSGIILLLPIGLYLLFGAPHFIRWQVKKTLEIIKSDKM